MNDRPTPEQIIKAAKAYRSLTVCYRTGTPPSERLFRALKEADATLAAAEEPTPCCTSTATCRDFSRPGCCWGADGSGIAAAEEPTRPNLIRQAVYDEIAATEEPTP